MKVFNVDMEKALWRRLKARVALTGLFLRDYVKTALEEALNDPLFDPKKYHFEEEVFRKNLRIPQDIWSEICLDAAKKDVTRRKYLSAAISRKLDRETVKYPIREEILISDAIAVDLATKENLLQIAAGKISVEELIAHFAQDLSSGDKRLVSWLNEKLTSLRLKGWRRIER